MSRELSAGAVPLSDLSFFGKMSYFFGTMVKTIVLFFIFALLIPLKYLCYNIKATGDPIDSFLILAIFVLAYSLVFMIYYILSEHVFKKMILGMIISIIGAAVTAIFPPIGIIIGIFGIISMISHFVSFVKMIPFLLLGVLVLILLYLDVIVAQIGESFNFDVSFMNLEGFNFKGKKLTFSIGRWLYPYIIVTFLISINLASRYSLKNAMLRQVVLFMAIPIMALIIWLIRTVLANALYKPQNIQSAGMHRKKIYVSPYTRADGTMVSGYTKWINVK